MNKFQALTIAETLKAAKPEQPIHLCGWVKSKRISKNVAFLMISDGSQQADLQLIVDPQTPCFSELEKIHTGAAIHAEGILKESPGRGQAWEVHVRTLTQVGEAPADEYPLQKKGHSLEFLREIAHLRPRTNTFSAVFRLRNKLAYLIHQFFQQNGFFWIHTPIITASDCEGAGEQFQVTTLDLNNLPYLDNQTVDYKQDFFGQQAYLTVSGQLEVEAFALAMSRVYTFGPTFRAENSNTTRHLAEFWMIEPEIAFATLSEDMDLAEKFLKFLFVEVVKECPDELAFFEKMYKNTSLEQIERLSEQNFQRISYTDAINELQSSGQKFEFPVAWGKDLQSEHEKFLTDQVFKGPVIVYNYPKEIKAFYMRVNDDEKTVAAMDVLLPRVGELIGGSEREERWDILKKRMLELGINEQKLWWYLDLRRFGSAPHAGFGLGFERLIQYVSGLQNIRDTIPFARTPGNIEF